jgi:HK97 family phage portal protein
MGFWSRVATFAQRKAAGDDDGEMRLAFEEWGMTNAGVGVTSLTALRQVAVMACVQVLSEDVAKLPLGIWRRQDDGGKKPARDHYLHRLLREPNAWQTAVEFIEMMQAALVLRGNAYAVIVRDGRGRPEQLIPIHPDRVALYEAPGGDYFFAVTRQGLHEMAVLRDLPILIHSDDMFHLRWLSTWNSLLGSSRIGLIREAVGLAMSQEIQAARLAGTGARPGGVLQTDKRLSKEVAERIKSDWQAQQGGLRNAGKTAVLEEGLKWEPMGMTMVDAQFIESRRFQIEDIARAFRVPLHKIGVAGTSEGSVLVQQDQDYLNSVLSAYCARWTRTGEKVFGLDGDELFLEFDYSHFLRADIKTRYEAYRTGIVGTFLTPNEARRSEGLPDDPKGNDLLQPGNVAPLGTLPKPGAAGPGSDVTGEPAPGGDGGPPKPGDTAPAT